MERTPSIEELIRIVSNITSSIGLEQGTLPTEDHVEPIKQVRGPGIKAGFLRGCTARQRVQRRGSAGLMRICAGDNVVLGFFVDKLTGCERV